MLLPGEMLAEECKPLTHLRSAIAVERRAVSVGQLLQRNGVTGKLAISVVAKGPCRDLFGFLL